METMDAMGQLLEGLGDRAGSSSIGDSTIIRGSYAADGSSGFDYDEKLVEKKFEKLFAMN